MHSLRCISEVVNTPNKQIEHSIESATFLLIQEDWLKESTCLWVSLYLSIIDINSGLNYSKSIIKLSCNLIRICPELDLNYQGRANISIYQESSRTLIRKNTWKIPKSYYKDQLERNIILKILSYPNLNIYLQEYVGGLNPGL